MQGLKDRIEDILTEKTEIEEQFSQIQSEKRQLISEKDELEKANEALMEEHEILRGEKQLKADEVKQLTDDIKQLAAIIQSMSELNKDLTGKVDKLNADLEQSVIASYEAKAKASNMEELEKHLNEAIETSKKIEEKNKDLRAKNKQLVKSNKEYTAICENIQGKIASFLTENTPEEVRIFLVKFSQDLGKIPQVIQEESSTPTENAGNFGEVVENENKELSKRVKETQNREASLYEEIDGLKKLLEKREKEYEEMANKLSTLFNASATNSDQVKEQLRQVQLKLGKKKNKCKLLQTKLLDIEPKYNRKLSTLTAQKEKAEKNNEELKEKIAKLKPQISGLQSESREQKRLARQYANTIQVLHDEFWKRDTALIKVKRSLIRAQKEIKSLKALVEKAETHAKSLVEHQTNKTLIELQSKDQQIALLKGMLKGNPIERRIQNDSLSKRGHSYRTSYDESSINTLNTSATSETRSFSSLTPSMLINKFLRISSLYKGKEETPTGTKPNLNKLVTNLRTKLKIFPSFSSSELNENVPELKGSIDTSKSQLTLDEVINAIVSTI
ncbi:unnamed protein product [Blepharisma stoltei]|uniref:Uncharacterized protein n=1 Tax=Blepharisma stoltei TaxID=1481888 RepID=A0AAU9K8R8_9CILI|nr:unnamed protein product [Blepharisma stoltei]